MELSVLMTQIEKIVKLLTKIIGPNLVITINKGVITVKIPFDDSLGSMEIEKHLASVRRQIHKIVVNTSSGWNSQRSSDRWVYRPKCTYCKEDLSMKKLEFILAATEHFNNVRGYRCDWCDSMGHYNKPKYHCKSGDSDNFGYCTPKRSQVFNIVYIWENGSRPPKFTKKQKNREKRRKEVELNILILLSHKCGSSFFACLPRDLVILILNHSNKVVKVRRVPDKLQ